jgi:hypothetical protein
MPELSLEIEIDYENDGITTRRVSVVDYEWNMKETAVVLGGFCHLRQSGRSFNSAKIRRCIDLSTSSLIPDLPTYIRNLEGKPAPAAEEIIERPMSRSQEKYHLRKKFVPDVLYYQFKRRFLFLFDDQCFKCGKPAVWRCISEDDSYMGGVLMQSQLVMDHHIPFEKGGRFEAGNLVTLCKRCNGNKGTTLPSSYYSEIELNELDQFLQVQEQLFPAERRYWNDADMDLFMKADNMGRSEILLSEGVNEELVRCCLRSQEHYYFCGVIGSLETSDASCPFVFKDD